MNLECDFQFSMSSLQYTIICFLDLFYIKLCDMLTEEYLGNTTLVCVFIKPILVE